MRYLLSICLLLSACASSKKTATFNARCGPTPLMAHDLTEFDFAAPQTGRVSVVRIFASWCPYCKADLERMVSEFSQGHWDPKQVHIYLIAYKNHSENRTTFNKFVKERLPLFKFPQDSIDLIYVDEAYPELSVRKNKAGEKIFAGWQGVPYALVFAKDQRLAFRGHFTSSPDDEERHYKYIGKLQTEVCP